MIKNTILSFDLDFTLIDNREGIVNSFNYALKSHGIAELEKEIIEKMIGTPLESMFTQVSIMKPSILSTSFRDYYTRKGIFQVKIYPGAERKLEDLSTVFTLGVVTSKKQSIAIKLLQYLNIIRYFDFVLGETEEIRSKKDPKIKEFFAKNYVNYQIVVIGDHPHDKELAELLKCPFIGLLTGNHTKAQLNYPSNSKTLILNNINEINTNLIYSII